MEHKPILWERNALPKTKHFRQERASTAYGIPPETIDDSLPQVAMLSILNIDNIRKKQRAEGNFDCYGKATAGYCDQQGCCYYSECLNICVVLRNLG